ncbi:B-box zinc finger protein [Paenibacillus sp. ISL-20]|uniref:B-box zinc finger protein n=1 Tax=Paenibacillus sp. ISL-20 TaxID=2819163 RepID=UPI001BEAA1CC|nr:B-box zinc finger protein [Paenibacillus sp. ISL-20]MBT2765354.1 hypothetical protein [Paenibacillus sp. ISL-20]
MEVYRCMNHPERSAVAQCTRCGKPVCEECHNPETGRCRYRCGEMNTGPGAPRQPRNVWVTVIVSILAILGGLALLLLTICGAILFSY